MSIYKMRTEFGHHFKWIMLFIAAVFVVGAVYQFGGAPAPGPEGEQRREILAHVNGIPISAAEYNANWGQLVDVVRKQGSTSTLRLAGMRAGLFMQLVESKMVLSAAEKLGVDVSEEAVEQAYEDRITDALRENRRVLLTKMTREQEAMDPRDDSEYTDALGEIEASVGDIEKQARATIPKTNLQEEVAREGIKRKLLSRVGRASDKDIADSYDTYKVSQIVVSTAKLPPAQARTKAEKIVAEAKSGKDFATLVKLNSDDQFTKAQGGSMRYGFENIAGMIDGIAQQVAFQQLQARGVTQFDQETITRGAEMVRNDPVTLGQGMREASGYFTFGTRLLERIRKMKPGEVAGPIVSPMGFVIVKLDSVTRGPVPKLNKKTTRERREKIQMAEALGKWLAIDAQVRKNPRITVEAPEMSGYYHELLAMRERQANNQKGYKKELAIAAKQLELAVKEMPSDGVPAVAYARILDQQGNTKKAVNKLVPLLDGRGAPVYGGDLRIWAGRMLLKVGDKKRALHQFSLASESAVADRSVHDELVGVYTEMKMPELVAAEKALSADIEQKTRKLQEREAEKNKPKPKSEKPKP